MVALDDVAQVRFQSFTENGREDLVADLQDADTSVIGTLSPISFLIDGIDSTVIPIAIPGFGCPYFDRDLVDVFTGPISSELEKFRKDIVQPSVSASVRTDVSG